MNFKRIISLLLVFVICFALTSCKDDKSDASAEQTTVISTVVTEQTTASVVTPVEPEGDVLRPLLYRVTDGEGNVCWLFGSIHIGRESYYPLPDYVMNAYNGADTLAVEADVVAFESDTALQTKLMVKMMYKNGEKISAHISEDVYNEAQRILKENNSYVSYLDYFYPVVWSDYITSFMVEEFGFDTNLGIDRYFLGLAKESGKTISEVESAEFQYDMLAGFDEEIQSLLIEDAVESYNNKEESEAELKEMMDLWASGDEKAFKDYLDSEDDELTAEEKVIFDRYNKTMETDRNVSMTDYAENALESGKEVFICVGSAHVIGEDAMVDLLTERGYTVELVTK